MPPHFRKPHARPKSAKEQLRESAGLHFLTAMDLCMAMCEDEKKGVYRRADPQEANEVLDALRQLKHACSRAKSSYLVAIKAAVKMFCEALLQDDDPFMRKIGECLQADRYTALAL